jgi:uncharacterized protein
VGQRKGESELEKTRHHARDGAISFDDPCGLTELARIVGGEERWQTIGLVGATAILIVAHTIGGRNNRNDPHHFRAPRDPAGENAL